MSQVSAPVTAQEYFDRGYALYQAGDLSEALYHFTQAIRLSPHIAAPYRYRAYAHSGLGKRLQAIADLDEAIRLRPDDPQAYADRAAELFHQKAFDACVGDCNTVLRLDAGRAALYGLRGRARAAAGESVAAEADLGRAIADDPDGAADYLRWRADLRGDCGDHAAAADDYTASIALDANEPATRIGRAAARFSMGDREGALADFDAAVELRPEAAGGYTGRARVRLELDDAEGALEDLDTSLRLKPGQVAALDLRAECLSRVGRTEEALADLDEVVRRAPKSARSYNARAQLHYKLGNYVAAIRDHMDALGRDPRAPETFNYLAWIWATAPDADVRQGQRAYEAATRACELSEWQEPEFLDTLAAAYAELGKFDEAANWQQRAADAVTDPRQADEFAARAERYRAGLPLRTPPVG